MNDNTQALGIFEKYLTGWVALCMVIGLSLGRVFPQLSVILSKLQIAHVSIPIAICLFFMIYPIMIQIDFREVIKAGKTPKPVATTLFVNWAIKPFSMVFFAWLFLNVVFARFIPAVDVPQYTAGMILLGIAPCTAMVLMWSYLARGNQGHTLVMVAINSLTMLILYAPLAQLLLGITDIPVPFITIALSVGIYVGLPLVAGYVSRKELIKRKGMVWYENRFLPIMRMVAISALLVTLIVLFTLQGEVIIDQPLIIAMIAIPLFIQFAFIFLIGYGISWLIGLSYADSSPTALIGASNHFEVAIAVAVMLFGLDSGAALATVVGVLIEVPVMLMLVKICLRTKDYFPRGGESNA